MKLLLPPGACNAHCHVFGPRNRFPYARGAAFIPAKDAPKEALFKLNDTLGLSRCVVVQSACHGFDNSVSAEAVAARPETYRAIALLQTDVSDVELQRLDSAGFRGVRFNYMHHLGHSTPIDDVLKFAARLEPLGWHLQIHGDPMLLAEMAPKLQRSPVPVVIDHLGRVDARLGTSQLAFEALVSLMDDPRIWVKVSGMDRISREGPPYADAQPYASALIREFGDRVLWGNDWPHPNHAGPIPDEEELVDLIADIAPTPFQRQLLLVDNPQRLYRFAALVTSPEAGIELE